MDFKRFDGFVGSIPQKFIDNRVPICPMCGSKNPHWTLKEQLGFVKLNRYLFKCENCDCILSATVADVTGIGKSVLSNVGLAKALSGKKFGTVYMKVDDVGKMQTTKIHEGKEMSLEELNKLAASY